jgi:hypothetical protein
VYLPRGLPLCLAKASRPSANRGAAGSVWPEQLGNEQFTEGIDQAALAADYQALTGRPLNLPA